MMIKVTGKPAVQDARQLVDLRIYPRRTAREIHELRLDWPGGGVLVDRVGGARTGGASGQQASGSIRLSDDLSATGELGRARRAREGRQTCTCALCAGWLR